MPRGSDKSIKPGEQSWQAGQVLFKVWVERATAQGRTWHKLLPDGRHISCGETHCNRGDNAWTSQEFRSLTYLPPFTLTWCLLTMSFNFPSSLGSISGHRKMLGRDRQLFCEEEKWMRWGETALYSFCEKENGWEEGLERYLYQGLLNGHEHFYIAVHARRILEIVTPPCKGMII